MISKNLEKATLNARRKAGNKEDKKLRSGSRATTKKTTILTDVLSCIFIRFLLIHSRRSGIDTPARRCRINDKDISSNSAQSKALSQTLDTRQDSRNTLQDSTGLRGELTADPGE